MGFPGGLAVKNPPASVGGEGSILGLGRFPGGGNGNPLQYSCLGSHMHREAWQTIITDRDGNNCENFTREGSIIQFPRTVLDNIQVVLTVPPKLF